MVKQYGIEADYVSVSEILRAEDERRQCECCTGLPCRKRTNQLWKPVVRVDRKYGLSIVQSPCVYGAAKFADAGSRRAGVPERYIGAEFADYEVTADNARAVKFAKAFCERRPNQGLYFYGNCGTGKTLLASVIARQYVKDWRKVLFGDMPSLLNRIKTTFVNPYASTDGKITDWNLGVMYRLTNTRYRKRRPVIVTSNYRLDELPRRLVQKDMTGGCADEEMRSVRKNLRAAHVKSAVLP